jgi:hypothetical protein
MFAIVSGRLRGKFVFFDVPEVRPAFFDDPFCVTAQALRYANSEFVSIGLEVKLAVLEHAEGNSGVSESPADDIDALVSVRNLDRQTQTAGTALHTVMT